MLFPRVSLLAHLLLVDRRVGPVYKFIRPVGADNMLKKRFETRIVHIAVKHLGCHIGRKSQLNAKDLLATGVLAECKARH